MNKKIFGLSFIVVILLLVGSYSSVIYAKESNDAQEKIIVEMKEYTLTGVETVLTEMATSEYEELQKDLEKISDAIFNQDRQKISDYEELLYLKGVFGDKKRSLFTDYDDISYSQLSSKMKNILKLNNDENISNYLCYFHTMGEGRIIFSIGTILSYILFIILDIEFIPIYLFHLIARITHIIPIRVLLPYGFVGTFGKVFTLGVNGLQIKEPKENETLGIVLNVFSGITIGRYIEVPMNPYKIFISGFSIAAFEGEYPFWF